MMTPDPLKSAISIGNVDDTSLALPSANQYRSGQQRVLDQVQTIKRSKSRHNIRSGSGQSSPISPLYDNVFTYSFKSLPATHNGNGFIGNGLSKTLSTERNLNRRVANNTKSSTVQRNRMISYHQYERGFVPVSATAAGKTNTSRSEPDLGWFPRQKRAVSSRRLLSNRSSTVQREMGTSQFLSSGQQMGTSQYLSSGQQMGTSQHLSSGPQMGTSQYLSSGPQMGTSQYLSSGPPQPQLQLQPQFIKNGTSQTNRNSQFMTTQSQMYGASSNHTVVDSTPKIKGYSGGISDITMREAVEYLSSENEVYQHCGASFIQHSTFIDDEAKQEVLRLNGILPLVNLLRSPSSQVQQTASAALRNLSFKNSANKEEVHHCRGVTEAATLLRETPSAETQKQLTGLLWNLSSVDSLKPDLVKSAMPVLMESVILPYTTGPDRSINDNLDPEVFFHATGCLRNLSSAKQNNRQAMRKCRGLIDSLVSYVQDSVAADRPDDKSLENCACILHNLTFQLEAEAPALFTKITTLARTATMSNTQGDTGPIGCFSPQSSKVVKQERQFDYPVVEELHPKGAGWLIHSKTLQSYLSLLGSSQRDDTLEACCGALQNLTAHQGIVPDVMTQIIVQKLNGLSIITPLLKSSKPNLQRSTVALVGNLAKNQRVQTAIARKALPDLVDIIRSGTKQGNESDDTLAIACQTARCVLIKEPELGKHLLSNNLINSLNDLSQNRHFPKSSKSAALFLYHLWLDKDIQSFLRKVFVKKREDRLKDEAFDL